MNQPEFHLISNGKFPLEDFARIGGLVNPWVTAVHIREKGRGAKEIGEGVESLLASGVPAEKIYINDRVDVAWVHKLKGTHLAYHSLDPRKVKLAFPDLRIGRSVHDQEEAKAMESEGADYLFFGHIFPTASKPGLDARGLDKLAEVVRSVSIPVIAIGGIKPENVKPVLSTGAGGIAVLSGLVEALDPTQMAKNYAIALYEED